MDQQTTSQRCVKRYGYDTELIQESFGNNAASKPYDCAVGNVCTSKQVRASDKLQDIGRQE